MSSHHFFLGGVILETQTTAIVTACGWTGCVRWWWWWCDQLGVDGGVIFSGLAMTPFGVVKRPNASPCLFFGGVPLGSHGGAFGVVVLPFATPRDVLLLSNPAISSSCQVSYLQLFVRPLLGSLAFVNLKLCVTSIYTPSWSMSSLGRDIFF